MERTPEEVMKGLEYHDLFLGGGHWNICAKCPYDIGKGKCSGLLESDAITLIKKLIAENAAMLDTLKRMAHSGGVCIGCVHMDDEPTILEHCEDLDFDCEKCPQPCACYSCKEGSNYEWRGVDSEPTTT